MCVKHNSGPKPGEGDSSVKKCTSVNSSHGAASASPPPRECTRWCRCQDPNRRRRRIFDLELAQSGFEPGARRALARTLALMSASRIEARDRPGIPPIATLLTPAAAFPRGFAALLREEHPSRSPSWRHVPPAGEYRR